MENSTFLFLLLPLTYNLGTYLAIQTILIKNNERNNFRNNE